MTRPVWSVTICAVVLAGLVPGCTHTNGMNVRPGANRNPAPVADAPPPQDPKVPPTVEEPQAAPPEELPSPSKVRSLLDTTSLLPDSPIDRFGKRQSGSPGPDMLILNP